MQARNVDNQDILKEKFAAQALADAKGEAEVEQQRVPRTYRWSDVRSYLNRLSKNKLDRKEAKKFLRDANQAWASIAMYLTDDQRLWFIRKVTNIFKQRGLTVPVWQPNILPDGSITTMTTDQMKERAEELEKQAREMFDPESDVPEDEQYATNLKSLWLKEARKIDFGRIADHARKLGIRVKKGEEVDYGNDKQIQWDVTYPDGSKAKLKLELHAEEEDALAVAEGNWGKFRRLIVPPEGEGPIRIRGTNITVSLLMHLKGGDDPWNDADVLEHFPLLEFDDLVSAHFADYEYPDRIKAESVNADFNPDDEKWQQKVEDPDADDSAARAGDSDNPVHGEVVRSDAESDEGKAEV